MIKKHIRNNENVAMVDPLNFIDNTFNLFSLTGENGYKYQNYFHKYFRNYNDFYNN